MTKIAVLLMLALALAAFGSGPLLFPDRTGPDVPPQAVRRLRTQLALGPKLRPAVLQVTEARMIGPTPDAVEGAGVFRTLFGVPVAHASIRKAAVMYDFKPGRWISVWVLFLACECALAAVVVRRSRGPLR